MNNTKSLLIKNQYTNLSYSNKQQGAALIVVLLMLILIMLIGAMAMRRSTTDLQLATSDQINTLLLQGADGANDRLETIVNSDVNGSDYKSAVIARNGIFGHFIANGNDAKKHEISFCYNPTLAKTRTNQSTVRDGAARSYLDGLQRGNCDPTKKDNYISARQTTMTQVSIYPTQGSTTADIPFGAVAEATSIDSETKASVKHQFDIRSTSAIPSYSDVGECFNDSSVFERNGDKKTLLSECLKQKQVPNKQLVEQVEVFYLAEAFKCIEMGKGTGAIVKGNENKCTL